MGLFEISGSSYMPIELPSASTIGWRLTALFLLSYICLMVYNAYFHPLAVFPGPKLAAATRWYESYFEILVGEGGQFFREVDRLHEEYGPIVRTGPNEVHVKDVHYYATLFGSHGKRHKPPYVVNMFGVPLSHPGTGDHDLHHQRKAIISPLFSQRSVTLSEFIIANKVNRMCELISASAESRSIIHLRHAVIATSVDIVTEFAFDKCFGALDRSDFSPFVSQMISGTSEITPAARQFSQLTSIAQLIPLRIVQMMNPVLAAFLELDQLQRIHITKLFAQYKESKGECIKEPKYSSQRNTMFNEILRSDAPEREKTIDRMAEEALAVLTAGSETTANTAASTIFHVLSNPGVLQKLTNELDGAIKDPSVLLEWKKLDQLPYLTAVIKEGLRITAPACGRLPLHSNIPMKYGDWTFPPGTYISMSAVDLLEDPKIYPDPDVFHPERWLTEDIEQQRMMNRAFVPFSTGARGCTGLSLAWAILYHEIAALVRRFDMELVDTIYERDVKRVRDYFAAKASKQSKGVRIEIKAKRT